MILQYEMTFSNYQGNLALTKERLNSWLSYSEVLAKDCKLQKSLESSVQTDPWNHIPLKAHLRDQLVQVISHWTFCNIILYNITIQQTCLCLQCTLVRVDPGVVAGSGGIHCCVITVVFHIINEHCKYNRITVQPHGNKFCLLSVGG